MTTEGSNLYIQTDKIDEKLICSYHNDKFVDPRFLPCHHSICQKCYEEKRKEGGFMNCKVCNQEHDISNLNELPRNDILMRILGIEPVKVSRGNDFDDLIVSARQLVKGISDLGMNTLPIIDSYENEIQKKVESIENVINLAVKNKARELENLSRDFTHKVDKIKTDCMLNISAKQAPAPIKVKDAPFSQLIKETGKWPITTEKSQIEINSSNLRNHYDRCFDKIKAWQQILEKPDLTENQINEIASESSLYIEGLKKEREHSEYSIFK